MTRPALSLFNATRRQLLRLLAGVALLPGMARVAWFDAGNLCESDIGRFASRFFTRPQRAAAVGRACLDTFPDIAPAALARVRVYASHGARAPHAYLVQRRRLDFAAGRTLLVAGWLIARCEADLCVVLALLA